MVRTKALYDELVEQPGATEWEQLDGENERIQSLTALNFRGLSCRI